MILGGGMAGLSAAWELTHPDRGGAPVSVTVVQRGWRLGGKAASSRGVSGRIEEHGLHVWLGYYDNAFRMMRECYDELDRDTSDPGCPIRSWRDAFEPSHRVGVADRADPTGAWLADFSPNRLTPGDASTAGPLGPSRFVERAVRLLLDLFRSIDTGSTSGQGTARSALTTSPTPPTRPVEGSAQADLSSLVRHLEFSTMAVGARMAGALAALPGTMGLTADPLLTSVVAQLSTVAEGLRTRLDRRPDGRRMSIVADLLLTCVTGMMADGLLDPGRGFAAVDHVDFRDWLVKHGAQVDTAESGIVTGMYDLVFAYEDGDPGRPRFAAGQGLELAARFFFDYKGAIFWKMQAGMGDAVIVPIVQVLQRRGVRFRLFTEVDHLELHPTRPRLDAVHLRSQTDLDPQGDELFERVGGLPCFPDGPHHLEHHGGTRGRLSAVRVGQDVDAVILATSIGVVPLIAGQVLERDERWRGMCDAVGTVATSAAQVWLTETEADLGLAAPGSTVAGWGPPFDTYASMSHLIGIEGWTPDRRPAGLAYLCGVLPDAVAARPAARSDVAGRLARYLMGPVREVLPRSHDDDGFRWDVLAAPVGVTGPQRLAHQFAVASTDPSDRYVQSLPGTRSARLPAAGSGIDGLVLAGDWIDNGLDAGCIEGAVISGVQAANAVRGRDASECVLGGWAPTRQQEMAS